MQLIQSRSVSSAPEAAFNELSKDGGTPVFLLMLIVLSVLFIPVRIWKGKQSRQLRFLHSQVTRLEEANESKNQLLSIIAHDLRSAVHALHVNMGKLKTALQKLLLKDAATLADETERLTGATQSLLNNLLYWSLSQTDQISYHLELVSLQPLLNGVCYDFLPLAASKSITLQYTLEQNFSCTCDVNTVKIIFRNLIDNAIKYTPAGGTVSVTARQEEELCAITVQDTGMGMAPHIIQALFTSDSTRIQQDAGGRRSTGLGLWLVKNMTERNGGTLRISSVQGVGTAITVTLPLSL